MYKMPVDKFGRTSNAGVKSTQKVPTVYSDAKQFLRHDGSVPATSPFNMDGNAIHNLPFPSKQTDAANREYVDHKINHLEDKILEYIDRLILEKVNIAVGIAMNSVER